MLRTAWTHIWGSGHTVAIADTNKNVVLFTGRQHRFQEKPLSKLSSPREGQHLKGIPDIPTFR